MSLTSFLCFLISLSCKEYKKILSWTIFLLLVLWGYKSKPNVLCALGKPVSASFFSFTYYLDAHISSTASQHLLQTNIWSCLKNHQQGYQQKEYLIFSDWTTKFINKIYCATYRTVRAHQGKTSNSKTKQNLNNQKRN